MQSVFLALLLVFLQAAVITPTAADHGYAVNILEIRHPWARPLPPTAKNGAAFLTITNQGNQDDHLVGAYTEIADSVEVHHHVHENGMMKMRKLEALAIPPGKTVVFESGGLHLMLMGLNKPLTEGESFNLELIFEIAGRIAVTVDIESLR